MVQGIGDPAKNPATSVNQVSAETSTTGTNVGSQPAVIHLEQHVQPQVVQSQVTSLGGQRIAISSALGGTVNVIASHSGVPTTTTTSGGQISSNATFQHYLIPGVSLGSQLQNITIPAQVALSGVRGGTVTQGQNALGNQTSTYTISTPQNLARILAAAASQNYSVTTTTARGVSGSQSHPHLHGQQTTLSGIHLQKVTTASGTTMITVPVTAATALQQRALVQGGSDTVAVRLTPAQVAAVSQHGQTLQLVDGIQFQGADVTKVHSYSMAKAIPNATITVGGVSASAAQFSQVVAQATMRQTPIALANQQRILVQKQLAGAVGSASGATLNSNLNVHRQVASNSVVSGGSAQNVTAHASASGSGGSQGPKSKRMRLEERPPPSPEVANMRKRFCEHRGQQFKNNKENYVEHLTELFFLQNGGNMMDYLAWKKRVTPQLLTFLKANALENDEEEEQRMINQLKGTTITTTITTPTVTAVTQAVTSTPITYVTQVEQVSTTQLKPALTAISSHSTPLKQTTQLIPAQPSTSVAVQSPKKVDPSQGPLSMPIGSPQKSTKLPTSLANRLPTRQHSISAVYDSSIGSQEEIVERAKQEAYVMQRVAELRKEGLWSSKRLPKVQEPPRAKAHWDYLIEEMIWLATDFAQERKWKKAAAKKCARMVMKYHQEKEMKAEKAEKEEQMKLRRIASQVAKEIKQFWSNIEKLVEFKQQTRLDEKRKKALDIHLNFIVDQTEKYSSWLTQGLMQNASDNVDGASKSLKDKNDSESSQDEDFEPQQVNETDDEETIAKEEAEEKKDSTEVSNEIEQLQKEGEVPLEDLIKSLPREILNKPATPLDGGGGDSDYSDKPSTSQIKTEKDEEYRASDEDEDDDEATIDKEEKENKNGKIEYKAEIDDLQKESEIPIEKLYEKYAQAYSSDFEMPEESEDETTEDDSQDSDEDEDVDIEGESDESEEEEMEVDNSSGDDPMEDIGMEYLIQDESSPVQKASSSDGKDSKGPSKEISDIAAAAEQFQPKGNTLSTTQVQTKVPFLLKHTLREYQHIGLDWLVAMQDRKLNGILADEMGLGKTIQTIALLAHLACEKGNWGPHLIVVPTSVMLNWEMELKKWCPGFKILTYYGTPKDRKQKRIGWTKPNAFHVCITSYKLVVQDHSAFRRKKWKYFILDEAQHIKNFKSQRWQMLLNFQSNRRLLLTGTPLQNSLMELWSLMHFLMPNVFQSHREFREWFVNPVTGMVEGNHEYNEGLIKRLHKILRPFLLRRLKCEVEKQLPQKYEHVIMCRLSTRQRYLYDDFMSRAKTKETLETGNFLSVLNVLMQLRKVCNHPNLFESRPTVSPFMMEGITFNTASLVTNCLAYDPFKNVSLLALNLLFADLEMTLTAFAAHRIRKFQTPPKYVEEIDSAPDPPPRCPPGKIRLHIKTSSSVGQQGATQSPRPLQARTLTPQSRATSPAPAGIRTALVSPAGLTPMTPGQIGMPTQQRIVVMTSQNSAVSNLVGAVSNGDKPVQMLQQQVPTSGLSVAQLSSLGVNSQVSGSTPITVQLHQTGQGGAKVSLPFGFGRLVQTASGQHLLLTSTPPQQRTVGPDGSVISTAQGTPVVLTTPNSQAASFQATRVTIAQTTPITSPVITPVQTTSNNVNPKPVLRVAPLNVNSTNSNSVPNSTSGATQLPRPMGPITVPKIVTRGNPPVTVPLTLDPKLEKRRSIFYMESLQKKKAESRKSKLRDLGLSNRRRCLACPIYGQDLIESVFITKESPKRIEKEDTSPNPDWQGKGYLHCIEAYHYNPKKYWKQTDTLRQIVKTPVSLVEELDDVLKRFVFTVPVVSSPRIKMHVSHPSPSSIQEEKFKEETMRSELSPKFAFMHRIISQTSTQFPELRLIQYDCGKLQTLDKLLWQLKSGSHRVLIFTQMTRMLDILEQFLNFHGHTYLRLDGSTRVDQRQALMERFNADKRIFCFILSTRSGGIGINLTGADTVVFYDSDWNPTMDAQAQDRCHRIGQTRDVHIYRLISDRTIEENILKKANQKRLLGDLAIEGGNFTSAFFKKNAVEELFGLDANQTLEAEKKAAAEAARLAKEEETSINQMQFEHALGMAEEDQDVQAAKTAKAEAAAEFAEFDESIPLETDSKDIEEKSQAEEELDKLMCQLTPVEKYAITFLESIQEPFSMEQLKQAEEEIEAQKKDWELGRLKALKEEEERRAALIEEDEENMLTYSREDSTNQVYISFNGKEQMPIWAPPTPPQNENDLYIDHSIGFWYEHNIMSETNLPPIYVKKEAKRLKVDPSSFQNAAIRKQKVKKEEVVHVPRSMFDRPSAAILKMRREAKLQKVKGLSVGNLSFPKMMTMGSGSMKQGSLSGLKSSLDVPGESLEWLIHEDWAILQVIQNNQDLPLSLTILSPAHIPNWDLVADVVNSCSRIYRSPKQCKQRYETVIVPREEGKLLYDTNPKKQKKSKGIYKTKNNRPMKTSQLYTQDNNTSFTVLYNSHFETIKGVANKRTPTLKPWLAPVGKNPKHAAVLQESGINYDQPLNPVQLAAIRHERISREKQKTQNAVVVDQQRQQIQQAGSVAGTLAQQQATLAQQQATQAVIASLAQAHQLQAIHAANQQHQKTGLQAGVATVSLAKSIGNSIVVNTAGGISQTGASPTAFATIGKPLGQGQPAVSVAGMVGQPGIPAASMSALNAVTLRAQRPASTGLTTTMTVQEMVAAAAAVSGQVRALVTTSGATATSPAVVSVAGLTAAQLQAATQRINSGLVAANSVTTVNQLTAQGGTPRNLTPVQLQALKHSALLRQQQQQRMQDQAVLKQQQLKRLQLANQQQLIGNQVVGGTKVAVSVNSPLNPNTANVVAQQRVVAAAAAANQQQQQAMAKQAIIKQTVQRAMTEAEVAQLLKRQQLQQQKQAVAAQLIAQAQLQQQQQTLQHVQQTMAGNVPVTPLVKTVTAPTSLGVSPSVTIPVSAVTMAGVNINVALQQGKPGVTANIQGKAMTQAVMAQQQLRQLQLQQHLLNQRKLQQQQQQQQKMTALAHVAKVQGKTAVGLPTQLNTVQIVQQGSQQAGLIGQQGTKTIPATTTMTVQQIQQVMKQVAAAAAQSNQGATAQLLPHAMLQTNAPNPQTVTTVAFSQGINPSNIATSLPTTTTVQARIVPIPQPSVGATVCTLGQPQTALKQAIQVVTAAPSLANIQTQQLRQVSDANLVAGLKNQPVSASSLIGTQLVTTSSSGGTILKTSSPATVVVSGQPQTATLLQQLGATSGGLTQQQVTLAVRTSGSNQAHHPTQVQFQIQPATSAQTTSLLSQNVFASSANQLGVANQSGGTTVIPAITSLVTSTENLQQQQLVHIVNSAMSEKTNQGNVSATPTAAQVVQAAIQAAKQQQQQQQQQQKQMGNNR